KVLYGMFNKSFGIMYWLSKIRILDLMIQAQSRHVHDLCNIFAGGTGSIKKKVFEYHRIQEELPSSFKIALDSNKMRKLERLMKLASEKYQEIGQTLVAQIQKNSRWGEYPKNK